ncbi:carboxypeptidase-like regulatory domain-containing protein [Confluentibacter sediminis]|uniref:carboxypeptidase-like regulatory domain-containing protein n=1 Tax=Confluentibacter sediminis TaxID=2219045 RepID=UPI0013A6FAF2|nr:carboxypeptidase-like regulatory domain-containing protein [Confluentibacter sediminis]
MKKTITFLVLLCFNIYVMSAEDSIRIYGQVTDFNNVPMDSVSVRLKNENFENLYETLSDQNGHFSLTVPKGHYYCLYAIKTSDYGKTKLEYWAWNIPAYSNLEINPQYERMEIYGVNVFEPQVSPKETYYIYFRPMSLTKGLNLKQNTNDQNIIDIAPSSIQLNELLIKINNKEAEILNITKIKEYARGSNMYGYMVQIKKPKEAFTSNELSYDKISILLHSKETNEYGKSDYFYEKK